MPLDLRHDGAGWEQQILASAWEVADGVVTVVEQVDGDDLHRLTLRSGPDGVEVGFDDQPVPPSEVDRVAVGVGHLRISFVGGPWSGGLRGSDAGRVRVSTLIAWMDPVDADRVRQALRAAVDDQVPVRITAENRLDPARASPLLRGGRLLGRRWSEAERLATRAKVVPDAILDGVVCGLAPYGALVDLGGVTGVAHRLDLPPAPSPCAEDRIRLGLVVRARVTGVRDSWVALAVSESSTPADPDPAPIVHPDLRAAVATLLDLAARPAPPFEPRADRLQRAIEAMTDRAPSDLDAALARLAPGLDADDPYCAGIVAMACGALVEIGADPEPAAERLRRAAVERLRAAASFAATWSTAAPSYQGPAHIERSGATIDGAWVQGEALRARTSVDPYGARCWSRLDDWFLPLLAFARFSNEVRAATRADWESRFAMAALRDADPHVAIGMGLGNSDAGVHLVGLLDQDRLPTFAG